MNKSASSVRRTRVWVLAAMLGMTPVMAGSSLLARAEDAPAAPQSQQSLPPTLPPLNLATAVPAPPQLAATSWILMDARTGQVLIEHDSHKRVPPASLTKLMTAYIAEYRTANGQLPPDTPVSVSEHAWRTGGSRMFLRVGTTVPASELMKGIVIQSGNDASVAMAEHISGSEDTFAVLMNSMARALGMKDSHFMNATGLPHDEHYSTAYDLSILARHIVNDYPEHASLYAQKEFTYNNIRQPNRNLLLYRDARVDGLKTGHTDAAGYCMVASAKQGDMRLIAVVMGTASEQARASETQKLLNHGFLYYTTQLVYKKGPIDSTLGKGPIDSTLRIWGGDKNHLHVGFESDVYATLPRGDAPLSQHIDLPSSLNAPIQKGQVVGSVTVRRADQALVQVPIVALEEVDEAGFFGRLWDSIVRFFVHLF